jgi:predicted dehydrogenase
VKVRIAVVGCGMIAELRYVPRILGNPRAELVAVCTRSEERGALMRDKFGVARAYTDLDRMLAEEALDLVVNLTPIQAHYPINLKALEAGKHLYSEKTLAATVEEATDLIEAAKAQGVKLGAAAATMLAPINRQVKRLVGQGAIGKVAFAKVSSSHGGPAYDRAWPADPTWFYERGAGPLRDMGVYGLHTITGLLGPAVRVTALSGLSDPVRVVRGGPSAGKRIDVEEDDVSLLLLDFGNSTFAMVDASFCVRATRQRSLAAMEIYGADGTIAADIWAESDKLLMWRDDRKPGLRGCPPTQSLEREAPPPPCGDLRGGVPQRHASPQKIGWRDWTAIETDPAPWDLASAVDHMVDCIAEDRPVIPSGEHARHVLEIMQKAMVAARTGETQTLETTFEGGGG